MVHSRVQNIRVKPASKLFPSGLHQKPFVEHRNGTRWSPQEVPEPRGSNMRRDHVPERRGVSMMNQDQGVHSVVVKSDQNAASRRYVPSPNHKRKPVHPSLYEQKPVQSAAETGGRRGSASSPRNVPQPAGRNKRLSTNNPISPVLEDWFQVFGRPVVVLSQLHMKDAATRFSSTLAPSSHTRMFCVKN